MLSILTMYNNFPYLFHDMRIPQGIDKETLINSIITELAELDLVYTQPDILRNLITLWSNKEYTVWEKMYNTTVLQYDPIENYNREEIETISEHQHNTGNGTQNTTTTNDLNIASTDTEKVAGFNSASLFDNSQRIGNVDNTGTVENDTTTASNSTTESDNTRTNTTRGNIGVTTSQQMIEQERSVSLFNIYSFIVESFKRRFCIMVY